jgi:hypothetical protein
VEKTFSKTFKQLQAGDFKSADVRKMPNTGFYRARLDIRDRLLFNFVTYEKKKYILLLEIIKDHNYAHSRFLRGAMIDESQFVAVDTPEEEAETASDLSYLNTQHKAIHILNKFISFDDFQQSVYTLQPPMIIVGSAGSGKTVLVLEKLKSLHGNVAYISLSKYLVDNASKIYYSSGYDSEQQETDFLSLNDYLALWQRPEGKEVDFKRFEGWFSRHAQAVKINEPYRVFEEFKGVISGSPIHTAWLSQKEYMELGVKQSIFMSAERERLYPLFLKYLEWLKEENLYDSNILCHAYLDKIQPYYDYIMVDEVQDITNIQLKCILASLKDKSHFILTGDSNQIVHPNFFSWSKIKTYFYETGDKQDNQIKILQTNYRNSLQVVELSNNLLKIKNARFGSIDRESNYLIQTVNKEAGEVVLYANDEKKKKELNRRTQNSTKYAVIVPNNQQKAKAAQFFKTPLIFNIQEAKGLEYENVILLDFISDNEAEFREIIAGVSLEDLKKEELRYNRAANKQDKDAEIYKFYINSFYVAITRAVKNIYIFEQRSEHPMLMLLQMQENKADIAVKETKSSQEEWLDEARRLEEQGKYEQAEQIRAKYLGYDYLSPEQLEAVTALALNPAKKEGEVKKERKQLFSYAVHHQRYDWIEQLAKLQFQRAILFMKEVRSDRKEYEKYLRLGNKSKVFSFVQKYHVDFTLENECTGLMLALFYGQNEIARELLAHNASITQTDKNKRCAFDYMLVGFFRQEGLKHKQQSLVTEETLIRFWEKVRPQEIVYECYKRQFHIGSHSMLFFLIHIMRNTWMIQPPMFCERENGQSGFIVGAFDMNCLEKLIGMIPDEILPPYRKKRSYINSVMALHEHHKNSPYCKGTFTRAGRGVYILNPNTGLCDYPVLSMEQARQMNLLDKR